MSLTICNYKVGGQKVYILVPGDILDLYMSRLRAPRLQLKLYIYIQLK